MDAGQITSDSLQYPLTNFNKILILGILTILSLLIIPGFLVLGYLFKIIKSSMEGSSELPDFNEWINMFVDGLKVFVVLFIYSIVPIILFLLGIWAVLLPMLTVPGEGSLLTTNISISLVSGIALIGIVLQVLISFINPIALTNMVYHNELKAAFRLKEIYWKIKEIGGVDYLIWYIIMLIIMVVIYYISFILIFPFFIGLIIVPLIILPFFTMFYARSIALVYLNAVSEDHEYYRHKKQVR
jgi:hypothetical protein